MKKNRHEAILSLIEKYDIGTQEELMNRLNEQGYKVTQATVSRDIKFLKLIKTPIAGGQYKYSYVSGESEDFSGKYFSILSHSITGVNFAGNIAVVKCYAGMAQAACAAVDSLVTDKVVGTLAGDDTIFVLCRDESAAADFKSYMENIIDKND
ncbi:MAG: arginine repressor [Oscillospiraceae bacterium]|nr:arginine repressor [Oscillospiraceae bacterium]